MANGTREDNATHLASVRIYEDADGVFGILKIADDEEEEVPVPAHMAGQLPLMVSMLRQQADAIKQAQQPVP